MPFEYRKKSVVLPEGVEIDIVPHALEGANQERPAIRINDIERTLLEPDWTNRPTKLETGVRYEAQRWIKDRTIKVYHELEDGRIVVVGLSANRRRPGK